MVHRPIHRRAHRTRPLARKTCVGELQGLFSQARKSLPSTNPTSSGSTRSNAPIRLNVRHGLTSPATRPPGGRRFRLRTCQHRRGGVAANRGGDVAKLEVAPKLLAQLTHGWGLVDVERGHDSFDPNGLPFQGAHVAQENFERSRLAGHGVVGTGRGAVQARADSVRGLPGQQIREPIKQKAVREQNDEKASVPRVLVDISEAWMRQGLSPRQLKPHGPRTLDLVDDGDRVVHGPPMVV